VNNYGKCFAQGDPALRGITLAAVDPSEALDQEAVETTSIKELASLMPGSTEVVTTGDFSIGAQILGDRPKDLDSVLALIFLPIQLEVRDFEEEAGEEISDPPRILSRQDPIFPDPRINFEVPVLDLEVGVVVLGQLATLTQPPTIYRKEADLMTSRATKTPARCRRHKTFFFSLSLTIRFSKLNYLSLRRSLSFLKN